MRRRAVEAGRERSRKIIKTSLIDPRTGEIRYNPAGRLLRDWYVHVYLNTLRADLGEPSVPIDAQQVEDTTSLLRRLRPEADSDSTLRAVGVIRNVAIDDAARAAAEIVERLHAVGARRAIEHAPDQRFDADELRVHVVRHWYLRCYVDHLEQATRSQQPLTRVTHGEEAQVALVLETRIPRRLIGEDGVPLVNAHGTVMTEVDRRLIAGESQVVESIADPVHHTDPRENLRTRVTRTWADLDIPAREHWLRIAGVVDPTEIVGWSRLRGETQSRIIQLYLSTHSPSQFDIPLEGPAMLDQPAEAARVIFGHQVRLDASLNSHVLAHARTGSSQSAEGDVLAPARASQTISRR